MKKHTCICLLVFTLVNFNIAYAQCDCADESKQEIGFSLKTAAVKSFGTLPKGFNSEISPSIAIGGQYDYFFNNRWSVGIGGQFAMQSFNFEAKNLNGEKEYYDSENEYFIFKYNIDQYNEKWKMSQLNIPLTVQYTGKGYTSIYVKTGIQYSLLMSSKAIQTWKNLDTKGYFPFYDIYLDAPLFAGFGFQEQVQKATRIDLKNKWEWIAEAGIKHLLRNEHVLYIGVYIDMSLNSQKVDSKLYKNELIGYTPELGNAIEYNSMYQLSQVKIRDYSVGLQLRYSIGL